MTAPDRAAGIAPPRDRSRRQKRTTDGESAGRRQILDGAIACILELGFYRASSNEIARRAGVSWGSIQYHFGSREALLLAVIEELNQRFSATVKKGRITGDTLEERLQALYAVLAKHYGDPIYLARLQIVLNLLHDPDTSAEVTTSLDQQVDDSGDELRRLLRDVLGEGASSVTRNVVFNAIRGMALSRQIGDAVPLRRSGARTTATDRDELARFLAGLAAAARLDEGVTP
ncbi:MAG: regulatory protein TetR [Actinomycetia bacterium]|nr:regulatory protein TetR [Actinomycetes bacterium]